MFCAECLGYWTIVCLFCNRSFVGLELLTLWFSHKVDEQRVTWAHTRWSTRFASVIIVKPIIRCCIDCQKRSGLWETVRHCLVEKKFSCFLIATDLILWDYFWHLMVSSSFSWLAPVSRNGTKKYLCLLHKVQGQNFESELFRHLMRLLKIDKTCTTSLDTHFKSVIKRMERTILNVLAKSIEKEQLQGPFLSAYILYGIFFLEVCVHRFQSQPSCTWSLALASSRSDVPSAVAIEPRD